MNNRVAGLYREFGVMVLRRCHKLVKNCSPAFGVMQDIFVNTASAEDLEF